jgi:hypothetical protein
MSFFRAFKVKYETDTIDVLFTILGDNQSTSVSVQGVWYTGKEPVYNQVDYEFTYLVEAAVFLRGLTDQDVVQIINHH